MEKHRNNETRFDATEYLASKLNKQFNIPRELSVVCITEVWHYLHEELKAANLEKIEKIIDYNDFTVGYKNTSRMSFKKYL